MLVQNRNGEIMRDNLSWLKLTIAVLASWRVTHLIAKEDGPGNIIYKIRKLLGSSFLGTLMDCYKCVSVWVALPFAYYIISPSVDFVVVWLAISAGTCLLYYQQDFYDASNIAGCRDKDYNCSSVWENIFMSCCGNRRKSEASIGNGKISGEIQNNGISELLKSNTTLKPGQNYKAKYTGKGVINITGGFTNQQYIFSETVPEIVIDGRDVQTFVRLDKFVIRYE